MKQTAGGAPGAITRGLDNALRRLLLLGVVVCAVAVCLAGCGSAAHQARAPTDPLLSRSECMRAHGVTNFPDPVRVNGSEGFPNTIGRPGSSTVSIEGVVFSGPVFSSSVPCPGAGTADCAAAIISGELSTPTTVASGQR